MHATHTASKRAFAHLLRTATRSTHSTAATAVPFARPSSATVLKVALAMLASGSAVVASTTLTAESAAAESSDVSASKKKKPHLTDLASLDFRTLGVTDCPQLPSHAPRWLIEQAADPAFQYRDLTAILDTSDHLLFDGLSGEKRLSESYYFCEKIDDTADEGAPGSNGAHSHPHMPSSLDFDPQTPGSKPAAPSAAAAAAPAPAAAAPVSWASYIASFFTFGRSSSSADSKKVTESPAAPAATAAPKAFTSASGAPVHLTAQGPEIRAIFHVGRSLCGHKGIVHGGMTAALMDDVSGAATFLATGGGQFTVNLNINYMKPVRAGQYVLIRAQAVKQERSKTYVNISVEDGTGTVFARGTALYVKPKMLPAAVMVAATQ